MMTTASFIEQAKITFLSQAQPVAELKKLYTDYTAEERRQKTGVLVTADLPDWLKTGFARSVRDQEEAAGFHLWYCINYLLPVNTLLPDDRRRARKKYLITKSSKYAAILENEAHERIGTVAFRPKQHLYPDLIKQCIMNATKAADVHLLEITHDPEATNSAFNVTLLHRAGNQVATKFYAYYIPLF